MRICVWWYFLVQKYHCRYQWILMTGYAWWIHMSTYLIVRIICYSIDIFSILKEEKNRNRADLWTNKTERLLGEKWKNSCVHTNSKTIIITRTITWTKNTDTVEHALLMPDVQKPCLLAHFVCIVTGLFPLFSLCPPGHWVLYPGPRRGWVGWAGKLPSCLRSRLTSLFQNLHSCSVYRSTQISSARPTQRSGMLQTNY